MRLFSLSIDANMFGLSAPSWVPNYPNDADAHTLNILLKTLRGNCSVCCWRGALLRLYVIWLYKCVRLCINNDKVVANFYERDGEWRWGFPYREAATTHRESAIRCDPISGFSGACSEKRNGNQVVHEFPQWYLLVVLNCYVCIDKARVDTPSHHQMELVWNMRLQDDIYVFLFDLYSSEFTARCCLLLWKEAFLICEKLN